MVSGSFIFLGLSVRGLKLTGRLRGEECLEVFLSIPIHLNTMLLNLTQRRLCLSLTLTDVVSRIRIYIFFCTNGFLNNLRVADVLSKINRN
jgi:hypothetical protein